MNKNTSSNIFNKNNVKVIEICDNDAYILREREKEEKRKINIV
jgi:hypothetical protein